MRKCRLKTCREPLPKRKDCTDPIQREGFCGNSCMWAHINHKREDAERRKRESVARENRAKKRRRLSADKSHQEKLTQEACNKLVRLLDHGKPCISCDEYRPLEAGHFRSVGSCPELRYCLLQIHGQCRACNQAGTRRMNRGRKPEVVAAEYERLLRRRMGDEVVDWIKAPHPINHYTIEELIDMRKLFRAECRRIERGEPTKWDWRKFSSIAAAKSEEVRHAS